MEKVNKTLKPTNALNAKLEAEKNERAFTNLLGDGIPELYNIGGNRHSSGGTDLNLPEKSFIFSDFKDMKIKDNDILSQFNLKPKKGGYTPADIAKKYDINKYKEILLDPDSTPLERDTAKSMIENYTQELGKLALVQESMKGFKDGIPMISIPYMEKNGIEPNDFFDEQDVVSPSEVQYARCGKQTYQNGAEFSSDKIPSDRTKHKMFNTIEEANNWLNSDASKEGTELIWIKTPNGTYKPYKYSPVQNKVYKAEDIEQTQGAGLIPEEQYNEYGGLYDYLRNNNYEKAKKVYDIWKNKKYTEKVYKNGKYETVDADIDKNYFENNYKEEGFNSPEEMFAKYFAGAYADTINYKNKHKDVWNDWSSKPSSLSPTKKTYLNTIEHTNQFYDETGWNDYNVKEYQSMQQAFNEFAKSDEGKADGLFTDSYNKNDPESHAEGDTTSKGSQGDTSTVDGKAGIKTLDWRIAQHLPQYELAEGEYAPTNTQQEIDYEPLKTHPQRPMPINAPAHLRQISAFNDLMGLRRYDPWQAPISDEQMTPEYLSNLYEINNLNSLAGTMAQNMDFNADPNLNRLNASAVAAQVADNILQSDANTYNKNVDIANTFESENAKLRQTTDLKRAETQTQLHDDYMRANQSFDNSRRALKERYLNSIADTLNRSVDLYNRGTNDFYFDQLGAIRYEPHYWEKINPQDAQKKAQEYIDDRAAQMMRRGLDPEKAYEQAQKEYKLQLGIADNPYESILRQAGIVS